MPERRLSSNGYEMNFAVNYLGPFLLTELLLERVRSTPSARIISLASASQQVADLNLGYISTNLSRNTDRGFERLFVKLFGRLAAPTWVGGERIVAATLDSKWQGVSGKYIHEDKLLDPNPLALDDSRVTRLMDLSRRMTGLADAKAA